MTPRHDRTPGGATSSAFSPVTSAIEATAAEWFARRDAGLKAGEEAAFRAWLTEDPRHAAAFAQLEAAWSRFGRPARAGGTDQLLGELARRRSRGVRRRTMAVATVFLLCAAGVGIVRWHPGQSANASEPVAVLLQPTQQKLPDGSTVTLREGARIEVAFTNSSRSIALRSGEALFQVQKDPARPFTVSADGVEVRAIGTAFTVQSGSGIVDVLVAEGIVRIGTSPPPSSVTAPQQLANTDAESTSDASITVTAGNRVVVPPASSSGQVEREVVPPAEVERRLFWSSRRVEFRGMPLEDAVSLMNREAEGRTTTRLRISDRALKSQRVSGTFRTDNMQAFVTLLEASFDVKADRFGDVIVLTKAP